jgi:hypothetical protein
MAQSSTSRSVVTTIALKVPEVIVLEVASGNSIEFDFTSDLSSLVTGIEKLNAVVLTYKSNVPWFLTVNATSATFNGGDPANPIPASIVQFRENGASNYIAVSMVPASVKGTSTAKNPRGQSTVGIDYKITPGYNYPAASDYSIGITYTISGV